MAMTDHLFFHALLPRAGAEVFSSAMYMSDYVKHLDKILSSTGEAVLENTGTVSHVQALEKARKEYQKYQVQTLSPVEEAYLQTIKDVEKTARKEAKE